MSSVVDGHRQAVDAHQGVSPSCAAGLAYQDFESARDWCWRAARQKVEMMPVLASIGMTRCLHVKRPVLDPPTHGGLQQVCGQPLSSASLPDMPADRRDASGLHLWSWCVFFVMRKCPLFVGKVAPACRTNRDFCMDDSFHLFPLRPTTLPKCALLFFVCSVVFCFSALSSQRRQRIRQ
jgi:hypothetical protein